MHNRLRYKARLPHNLITSFCFACNSPHTLSPTAHLFCSADCNRNFMRHNRLCLYCNSPATTKDHTIPIARGGSHERVNCCKSCNSHLSAFSDTDPFTFEGRLLRLARRLETEAKLPRHFPFYKPTEHQRLYHLSLFYLQYTSMHQPHSKPPRPGKQT